jgi:hypothetical protein
MEISVVLTSAAVAAVVSGLFTLFSQWRERQARQKELLMKTAADLATKAMDQWLEERAKTTDRKLLVPLLSFFTYYFHRQLSSLLKDGKLPPEEQERYEDLDKRLYASQVKGGEP